MLSFWPELEAALSAILAGMAEPWVIALTLVLITFIFEDVAIAAGAALGVQGTISWELAFLSVAGGIALGDLGLYLLGGAARKIPALRRRLVEGRLEKARGLLTGRFLSAILLARVVPGLRLFTYTMSGFLRLDAGKFVVYVLAAVSLWTAGLFWLGTAVGHQVAAVTGLPAPVAVALPIALIAIVPLVIRAFGGRRMGTDLS